ncbi:MAG: YcaO-like family protein, partial [Candidatus Methanomethylicaceae archaeon]
MQMVHVPSRVEDAYTGLVSHVFEVELYPSDPAVWVMAAKVADVSRYDLPCKVAISGSGAGLTYSDAYGAAIGESVERYACILWHPEDVIFGTYIQMQQSGYNPVEPSRWALFHANQYANLPFAPFNEDTPIGWVPAASLTYRRDCLVPACMVYMPYRML